MVREGIGQKWSKTVKIGQKLSKLAQIIKNGKIVHEVVKIVREVVKIESEKIPI